MSYNQSKKKKAQNARKSYGAGRRDERLKQQQNSNNDKGPSAAVYAASLVAGPIGPLLVWFGWGK